MRVLAVDDDQIILELLKEIMACNGYENISTAASGTEALRIVEQAAEPFECFLLDIQMPQMDGIELCARLRARKPYAKVPIVMITAMSDKGYVDRAFAAGASDYVTKPFNVLELGTRVNIAARMVEELRAAEVARFENVTLRERLEARAQHEITDPLPVEGVKGFLDYPAFENYLLLQSRQGFFTSGLLAMQVANIREIYQHSRAEDFYYLIADIGETIAETMAGSFDFLTYRGSGVYVCVYDRGHPPAFEELPMEIEMAIERLGLVYADGRPMDVVLNIGDPVAPGIFSSPGSLKVLTRAIDSLSNNRGASARVSASEALVKAKELRRKPGRKPLFGRLRRVS